MSRWTRAGNEFSPYALAPPIICCDVVVSDLLRRQIAEMDAQGDSTDDEFGDDDSEGDVDADEDAEVPYHEEMPSTVQETMDTPCSSSSILPIHPLAPPQFILFPIHPHLRVLTHTQHVARPCGPGQRPQAPKNSAKRASHIRRNRKLQDAQDALGTTLKLVTLQRVHERAAPVTVAQYDLARDTPVDSSAFTVRCEQPPAARSWRLPDYVAHGYRHIRWLPDQDRWVEGACVPLTDAEGRLLGLLGGKPREEAGRNSWKEVVEGIPALIESAKRGTRFPKKMCIHRRGRFPAPAAGWDMVEEKSIWLIVPCQNPCGASWMGFFPAIWSNVFQAGSTMRLFEAHNPPMFNAYAANLTAILECDNSLRRNFSNSVFALLTVNAGRRTVPFRSLLRSRVTGPHAGAECRVGSQVTEAAAEYT
ncbi:hypothetical protein BDZ89DRAFT_1137565 [Hymenopellis radicata]|nr:hypothetical protein BDZ89DRAFT_1137565 [Hymenopellis radicata]